MAPKVPSKESPLIIEYTNLLHTYRDPNHRQVLRFREEHAGDAVFQRRADALDKVWRIKEELMG